MSFEPPDDDPDEVTRRLLLRLFEVPYEALLRTGAPHFSSRLLDCLHISLYPNVDELVTSMHTRRRGLEREEREEREEQRDEERQGTEGANRQKGEGSGGTGCDGEKVSNPGHQLCSAQPKEKLCHHLWRLEILMRREAELLRRDTEGFEEQQAGDSSLPTRNREDLNAERPPKGPHETTSETSCSAEHVVARRMRGRNTMAYAREEEADWDQETDDGEDDLVNKACCVPVAQTAYELLEARREGAAFPEYTWYFLSDNALKVNHRLAV
ncbi:hypothetical protein BESB_059350 [Besnoitia besnoiti]|uniref:Uncharacterized protein n=1 Tax=Besnoitia besnoiti TaxID=94643 RepID=A0A2A9M993_BESBE|nr:hypothetical protein BESB_059350 [Besnoitia besnoiti]PFH35048.1 hypothetical protein BESB_059350 [Besnoitia besnoiti]